MSYLFELPCFADSDGKLVTFESNTIPGFQVSRIFYIYDVPGGFERANHACMNASTVLIAITGSITLSVETDGEKKFYELCESTMAVYAPPGSWIVANDFNENALLMGLSDLSYDLCEYIDDYAEYRGRYRQSER